MDEFDRRLRTIAQDQLDRESAAVPTEDDLVAVRARAAGRPAVAARPPRSWPRLAVAATLVLFVGGAVTLLATRDGGEESVAPVGTSASTVSSDLASTLPSTTIGPVETSAVEPAVAEPSMVAAGQTVSITPSAEVTRTCQDIVSVLLRLDEEVVPVGMITPTGWDTQSPSTIPSCLGDRTSDAVELTVPDLEHGEYWFCIAGFDTREGCAIVTVASVTTTTAATAPSTAAPSTTTTVAPPTDVPVGYFERRFVDAPPYFELRQVAADGSGTSTLATAEVEQLLRREFPVGDGRSVRLLPEEEPYGRCDSRQFVATGPVAPELIGPVRSLAAATDGVVVVGVDVCPDGAVWGDPGTRFELRRIDLATGATAVLHVREPGDGDTFFADRNVVYAGGEFLVESVSPDGAFVAVAEPYTTEDTRYHVFSAEVAGGPIELDSACPDPRDLVGPPQFVGDGRVVVARECSPVDGQVGGLIVELVSLESREPIWSVAVEGVAIDSYSHTVSLDAGEFEGRVWALVSGSAGVEQPIEAAAVTDGAELPLPGGAIVAFDPRDLIEPWDPYP